MPTYPFLQIDAFTTKPLQGNPCAVVLAADDLSSAQMQAIAREMNLSETAFLLRSTQADFRARYFTPSREIPLAGHPTIALTHALLESGAIAHSASEQSFRLELPAGIINVSIQPQSSGAPWIVMTQRPPQFLNTYAAAAVLPCFGLPASAARPDCPIQTVSTGTPQLMVAIQSLTDLQHLQLDLARLQALSSSADFFSIHLFCLPGLSAQASTFARHIVPPPDSFEDPFTGSATGGMAAFAWHYGLLATPTFIAEQGHWQGRAGQARVTVLGERANPSLVQVGGQAVTVVRGQLHL